MGLAVWTCPLFLLTGVTFRCIKRARVFSLVHGARNPKDRIEDFLSVLAAEGTLLGEDQNSTDTEVLKLQLTSFTTYMRCDITFPAEVPRGPRFLFVRKKKTAANADDDPVELTLYEDEDGIDPGSDEAHFKRCIQVRVYSTGKECIDWVSSRCHQSGNQAMWLIDDIFRCFHANSVSLNDYSVFRCLNEDGDEDGTIRLSLFRSLTQGKTFYQKHGFEKGGQSKKVIAAYAAGQAALQNLTVEELAHVQERCIDTFAWTRVNECDCPGFMKRILAQTKLVEYDKHGRGMDLPPRSATGTPASPGTIGHFTQWLVHSDCKNAGDVLDTLLPFPCEYYNNQELREWDVVPVPRGYMRKIYTNVSHAPS